MPRRPRKKEPDPGVEGETGASSEGQGRSGAEALEEESEVAPEGRSGLPRPESIISETEFTSPSGSKYRIIHTTEVDPSDERKPTKGKPKRRPERKKE
jgi:hypothetical protein